jgi:hypothetical protein
MKLELAVGIVLFVLFVLFTVYGGAYAAIAIFYFGCIAIGWNIPNAARWLIRKYNEWKEA